MTKLRLYLCLFVLLFSFSLANRSSAHNYGSMANSTITAADNRLVFHYKIDEAAILFALPDIQAKKNGVLHEEEFNRNKAAILSLISSNVLLLMDGKPLTPVSVKSQLMNDSSLPLPVVDVEYIYEIHQITNLTLEDHFPQLLEVNYSHYGTYQNGSVSQNFDLDKKQPAVSFSQSAPQQASPETLRSKIFPHRHRKPGPRHGAFFYCGD